jgi:hypothetical protein
LTHRYAERAEILLTPFGRFTRFSIASFPSRGAFKGGAERHAQGNPEADVMQATPMATPIATPIAMPAPGADGCFIPGR